MVEVVEDGGGPTFAGARSVNGDAPARPGEICRELLAALDASEGRRRRRKRDTTPDAIGLTIKRDRKSTRLNSSHGYISYAVFCLKKKKQLRLMRTIKQLTD